jgi:curved DNA-binding protein
MAVQYKDYYETLGVSKTASQDEIRKSFRKLARKYHPDVAKDKKAAESKFKEINEAYEVLGDAEKRAKYDQLGADWDRQPQRPPPGAGGFPGGFNPGEFGGTGFSDFFEQFFGGRAGRGRGGRGHGFFGEQPEMRGGDIEADLMVTIEEALHGARKKISFRRQDSPKTETYEVKIPKGVREGQRIRLAGQGAVGTRKELSGDLYLVVRLAQHPDYRIDGDDLVHDLELPAWDAVLGTEVNVPTPDGPVRLKIPPGTQNGQKLRLRGRGLVTGSDKRGDFYVQIEIVVPKALTDEARQHWEALARLS